MFIGGTSGGSLDNPLLLYSRPIPGTGGHSAAFTFDGKVYVHGWEPGGGSGARCTATGTQITPTTIQTDDMKSYFFFNVETGEQLGKFVLPRDQTLLENCTIHNYNIVPLRDKDGKPRYVLVSGNYQAGISGRLHRSGPRAGDRLRRSPAAGRPEPAGGYRARRRLVNLLVQRKDLRVRHHEGPDHLAPRRRSRRAVHPDAVPQPANN